VSAVERLVVLALYLDDGDIERRTAPGEVPQVGDRIWAHDREWLIQRRARTRERVCDFELDAVAATS
jgi:hypothetical protein